MKIEGRKMASKRSEILESDLEELAFWLYGIYEETQLR